MARRTRTEQVEGLTRASPGEEGGPATRAERGGADEDVETLMRMGAQVGHARQSLRAYLDGLDPAARKRLEAMLYRDGPTDLSRPLGGSPSGTALLPTSRRTADLEFRSAASRFLRGTER